MAITAPTANQIKNNKQYSSEPVDNEGDGIADNAFALISDAQADVWAGLLVYNTSTYQLGEVNGCDNKIAGTTSISATGAFYFPNTCLVFTGNNQTGATATCLQLIAGNLSLAGDAGITNTTCEDTYNLIPASARLGLVE